MEFGAIPPAIGGDNGRLQLVHVSEAGLHVSIVGLCINKYLVLVADKEPTTASRMTAKVTMLGLRLELLSGGDQQATVRFADLILILHTAPASEQQLLGPADFFITHMDLTVAAVQLTANGPGECSHCTNSSQVKPVANSLHLCCKYAVHAVNALTTSRVMNLGS